MRSAEDYASRYLLAQVRERIDPDIPVPSDKEALDSVRAWSVLRACLRLSDARLSARIAELADCEAAESLDFDFPELQSHLPRAAAIRLGVLPLKLESGIATVAVANPFDPRLDTDLVFALGHRIRYTVAPPDEVAAAIDAAYHTSSAASGVGPDTLRLLGVAATSSDASPIELLPEVPGIARSLMLQAIDAGASDLHVQPFMSGAVARIRVDGMLRRISHIPTRISSSLVRYFKAQAGMDPTDFTVPQDGRMAVGHGEREFDLRISTIPISGRREKLVVRLLKKKREYNLGDLGMSLDEVHTLRRLAAQPSGVLLLCGPTGSGKTTTLYSLLSELNDESISIATVENPVEYEMPGLAQTEVNERAGMTFAAALRSVLRQDPDVILLGEIRDEETARIALQSALTGHLVFSTLHTKDSLAALPRLIDLGLDSAVVGEAIAGISSQRLVRRLCDSCSVEETGAPSPTAELFHELTGVREPKRPGACAECEHTGYRGRIVISEIIDMSPELAEEVTHGRIGPLHLRKFLRDDFRSIASAAARRVISGDTSSEEVMRVLGRSFWKDIAAEYGRSAPDLTELYGRVQGGRNASTGILVAGDLEWFETHRRVALEEAWFSAFEADSPERARSILEANDNINFVVLALPPEATSEEVVGEVDRYRVAMAWSRLPALLVRPDAREEWEELLTREGATSRFATRSISPNELVHRISTALSAGSDYRWQGEG